jgi:acyl carrier protein
VTQLALSSDGKVDLILARRERSQRSERMSWFVKTEDRCMQRNQIRSVLKGIFEDETGKTLAQLHDHTMMAEEFELDSVDMVSLIMQVESRFRIRMTHGELGEVKSVGSLVNLIEAKILAAAAQPNRLAA